ncbi:hypothetical protein LL972_16250 [Xanthomonas campestris pv. asclepiadis]|uniref:hypothetical protein n=1 Tax=Xanthomonas campestris TaxID=339 RepID=UPI001E47BCC2|nr:hypothetical protein [Xanthomonas campestris]MCC4617532.1 hypothetical protein [Xanthomonas campestris pv. asclepiadis]
MSSHRSIVPPQPSAPASNRQAWHDLPDLQQHHSRRRRLSQLRWMASIACAGVAALWCGPLLWSWLRYVTA